MQTIWLFDIDGVLVYPGGYQAALKATVNHFSRAMGLGDHAPDDETIQVFEACGLSSEWDSAPMCVAVLLLEAARAAPALQFQPDFWQSVERVRASGLPALRPRPGAGMDAAYRALARRVGEARGPNELAGPAALRVLTEEWLAETHLDGRREALAGALGRLLGDTRDFPGAPGMYVFQHYALGSKLFVETYGLPAAFQTPGLLATHDRPALSPEALRRVRALMAGGLRASIITARPCRAPRDLSPQPAGYSPEAEAAASLVGLEDLPLIGFGRLEWLGRETGRHPEELLKPSPVHALAAIAAAHSGHEAAALRAAYRLAEAGEAGPAWERLAGERVALHVFEDSPGGMRAVREAAQRLKQIDVDAEVYAWGVTTHPGKAQALRHLGAQVLPDVNEAVEAAAASK